MGDVPDESQVEEGHMIVHSSAPQSTRTCMSAEEAWGLGTPGDVGPLTQCEVNNLNSFKKALMEGMGAMCDKYGGPRQYLCSTYDTPEKRRAFAVTLLVEFPMCEAVTYHTDEIIPGIPEEQRGQAKHSVIHLPCFNFTHKASGKPPPGKDLCLKLTDEILTDGVLTHSEPILVSQPESLKGSMAAWCNEVPDVDDPNVKRVLPAKQLCAQSLGYVKGQLRILTTLGMASLALEDGLGKKELQAIHPKLYNRF